jgi:hypothetical protein
MAGSKRLQKLASNITPPAKPNIASISPRFDRLKKNTKEAPNAVTSHVNIPEYNAPIRGFKSFK